MTPPRRRGFAALVSLAWLALACHEVHFESHVREGEIDLYDHLFAVSVPDDRRAVAVGYQGAIYATEDGGDSWTRRAAFWGDQAPRSQPLLYDVSLADTQRGWVVGQLGTVLHTADGGATWVPQVTSKAEHGYHLFSVHAIDANTAWAVGEWGTRIYTDDGGASWQDRSLTIATTHPQYVWLTPTEQERVRRGEKVFEDVSLNDVYCRPAPSQRCWIVGEFGYIFWSDDRGRTWNPAEIVGTDKVDPVRFAFDESEVSEADAQRIQTFVEVILDQEHLNVLIEPFGSAREIQTFGHADDPGPFFDILDARATGVRTVIEETGILSDRLRMRGTPPWDYEDFLEDDPGFLDRYLEGRRADASRVTVEIAQNPYLFRIRFADDVHGIISGLGGVVLTSDDGGATWRYGTSGTKQALYALAPTDGMAIAVGEKGMVRESHDAGATWGPPPQGSFPETFTFMRDLEFSPSRGLGMIVGQRGLVMRTRDQGAHWERVLPPAEEAAAE